MVWLSQTAWFLCLFWKQAIKNKSSLSSSSIGNDNISAKNHVLIPQALLGMFYPDQGAVSRELKTDKPPCRNLLFGSSAAGCFLFEEMYVVKILPRFFFLILQPILVTYLLYSPIVLVYTVSLFLIFESFTFQEVAARITVLQVLFATASPDLTSRHPTALETTITNRAGKPI